MTGIPTPQYIIRMQRESTLLTDIIIKKKDSKNSIIQELKTLQSQPSRTSITDIIQQESPQQIYQPLTESEISMAGRVVQGWRARKEYKKLRKDAKQRRKALEEFYQTERDYRNDIEMLDQHLRIPLLESSAITMEEDHQLFPNFLQFKDLSDQLLAQLTPRFNKYHMYQKIGDILMKKAPYFKIYIQYMNSFEQLWNNMTETKIVNVMNGFQQRSHQNNDAKSYLSKPFQRLTKYKALITPILDKTNKQHPDYIDLVHGKQAFQKAVEKVNDLMDRIMMNKRIQELDREFSTEKYPILDKNRRLFFQEQLTWISQGKISISAYFFNDMIIFINNEEAVPKKVIKRLTWNEKSSVISLEDGKTMTNVINISCPDGNVTLECGQGYKGAEKKENIIKRIKAKMCIIQCQNVIVQALGTQQLNSTSLSKHTIYIMQVKIGPFRQNLFIRFKQLLQVLNQLSKHYRHLHLPALQKKWFTNHKSNIIQERKVLILQILQTILNDPEVQKSPEFMINKLQLREKFYELPKMIEDERQRKEKKEVGSGGKKATAFEILCTTELQLGRYNFHGDQVYRESEKSNIQFEIDVKLLTGDTYKLKIKETDTVEDVCNKVSMRAGLLMNRDFRLFHEIGKKESRALDHDRVVIKVFDMKEEKEEGFFSKITTTLKNMIVPDTKPVLTFKKYLYLPFKLEQHEYKRDLNRLRLWVFQILFEIKDMKYHLTLDQYCFFAAIYLYIKSGGEVEQLLVTRKINMEVIQEAVIPELIFKCENISEDQWKEKILKPLRRLDEEITAMKNYNENNVANVKKDIKIKLFTDKTCLCYQIVMNKIRTNLLFSSNLFYIQPHQSLNPLLPHAQLSHNMWLAIKLQGIYLLKPSIKQPVFQIQYNSINTKTVHPSTIIFNMYTEEKYKLNTYQSFEISQLIDYLKKLNEVIEMVSKKEFSQEDAVKTSIYMDSLVKYRESCK